MYSESYYPPLPESESQAGDSAFGCENYCSYNDSECDCQACITSPPRTPEKSTYPITRVEPVCRGERIYSPDVPSSHNNGRLSSRPSGRLAPPMENVYPVKDPDSGTTSYASYGQWDAAHDNGGSSGHRNYGTQKRNVQVRSFGYRPDERLSYRNINTHKKFS
jgi:hypothetical protein